MVYTANCGDYMVPTTYPGNQKQPLKLGYNPSYPFIISFIGVITPPITSRCPPSKDPNQKNIVKLPTSGIIRWWCFLLPGTWNCSLAKPTGREGNMNGKSCFFWDGYLEGGIAVSEKAAWKKERKLHKFRWLNETWPLSSECLSHYLEYLVTCDLW